MGLVIFFSKWVFRCWSLVLCFGVIFVIVLSRDLMCLRFLLRLNCYCGKFMLVRLILILFLMLVFCLMFSRLLFLFFNLLRILVWLFMLMFLLIWWKFMILFKVCRWLLCSDWSVSWKEVIEFLSFLSRLMVINCCKFFLWLVWCKVFLLLILVLYMFLYFWRWLVRM